MGHHFGFQSKSKQTGMGFLSASDCLLCDFGGRRVGIGRRPLTHILLTLIEFMLPPRAELTAFGPTVRLWI